MEDEAAEALRLQRQVAETLQPEDFEQDGLEDEEEAEEDDDAAADEGPETLGQAAARVRMTTSCRSASWSHGGAACCQQHPCCAVTSLAAAYVTYCTIYVVLFPIYCAHQCVLLLGGVFGNCLYLRYTWCMRRRCSSRAGPGQWWRRLWSGTWPA